MRSDTDSGTAQSANGCEPALNERLITTRHLHALRSLPPASACAVQSSAQRRCVYEGGWS
jgi:hypothetical protein